MNLCHFRVTSLDIYYIVPKGQEQQFKLGSAHIISEQGLLSSFITEDGRRWNAGDEKKLIKVVGMDDVQNFDLPAAKSHRCSSPCSLGYGVVTLSGVRQLHLQISCESRGAR